MKNCIGAIYYTGSLHRTLLWWHQKKGVNKIWFSSYKNEIHILRLALLFAQKSYLARLCSAVVTISF